MCNCPEPIECEVCGSLERVVEWQSARICESCLATEVSYGTKA